MGARARNRTICGIQSPKVKVVGTFHVPFTRSSSKSWIADGTAERACYFCRLYGLPVELRRYVHLGEFKIPETNLAEMRRQAGLISSADQVSRAIALKRFETVAITINARKYLEKVKVPYIMDQANKLRESIEKK